MKFSSIVEFVESLPEDERILTDILREIVLEQITEQQFEKLTNNVPYYFGHKRICMIWPASIKGGGIKKGVLFGFSKGNMLNDPDRYLDHGTNKRIFYKIFRSPEEIDVEALVKMIQEAFRYDRTLGK